MAMAAASYLPSYSDELPSTSRTDQAAEFGFSAIRGAEQSIEN